MPKTLVVKFLQIWSHCLSLTLVRSGQSWSRMWVWWRTCHSPIWPRGRSGAAGRWLARWTPSPSTGSLTLMTCVPASACQAEEQPWRGGILVRWLTLIKKKIRKSQKVSFVFFICLNFSAEMISIFSMFNKIWAIFCLFKQNSRILQQNARLQTKDLVFMSLLLQPSKPVTNWITVMYNFRVVI